MTHEIFNFIVIQTFMAPNSFSKALITVVYKNGDYTAGFRACFIGTIVSQLCSLNSLGIKLFYERLIRLHINSSRH